MYSVIFVQEHHCRSTGLDLDCYLLVYLDLNNCDLMQQFLQTGDSLLPPDMFEVIYYLCMTCMSSHLSHRILEIGFIIYPFNHHRIIYLVWYSIDVISSYM